MKNNKINIIRKKLDKLDLNMLSLIKSRSLLVNKILDQKKFKNQIIDKKRIRVILKKIYKEFFLYNFLTILRMKNSIL